LEHQSFDVQCRTSSDVNAHLIIFLLGPKVKYLLRSITDRYAASLWDRPLKPESPKNLLTSHENNFLKDIRDGTEKRVETRIAAARRFAVRVRNHAKMVDCYINTYNNHRSFFSDKKKVSNDIIDHPQVNCYNLQYDPLVHTNISIYISELSHLRGLIDFDEHFTIRST